MFLKCCCWVRSRSKLKHLSGLRHLCNISGSPKKYSFLFPRDEFGARSRDAFYFVMGLRRQNSHNEGCGFYGIQSIAL